MDGTTVFIISGCCGIMGNNIFLGYFSIKKANRKIPQIQVRNIVGVFGDWSTLRKTDWVVENNSHSFNIYAFGSAFLSDYLLAEFFLFYAKLLSVVYHGLSDFFCNRLEKV